MLVFVILGVAFLAVGMHLLFWSRGQSRLIRGFAESKGLVYRAAGVDGLEERVNACVAFDEPALTRTFGQFGDVVSLGHGTLFRAVELLDLTPWGRAEYVQKSRVAVVFPFRSDISGFFMVSPDLAVYQRYPESPSWVDRVQSVLEEGRVARPPCPLSLTIMRGQVVAYLEPAVTGAVSRKHLDYLAGFPNGLSGRRG
jgi:hypothetical protein